LADAVEDEDEAVEEPAARPPTADIDNSKRWPWLLWLRPTEAPAERLLLLVVLSGSRGGGRKAAASEASSRTRRRAAPH